MQIDQLHEYCMSKKGVTEHFPFDDVTLVFKVMNKMFLITGLDAWEKGETKMNVKCDPEWSQELRAEYDAVNPGWHMNKKHWNTVTLNGDVPDQLAFQFIDHSYDLIVDSLPKKVQEIWKNL